MSAHEKHMLLVFALVSTLWMTTALHGIHHAAVALLGICALLLFGVSIYEWSQVFHRGQHHEGFFTAYRSLDLVNGVAPTVPFMFLVLAILCFGGSLIG